MILKKLLNPIEHCSEIQVLISGIFVAAASILLCTEWNIVLDGYLDIHDISASLYADSLSPVSHIMMYLLNIVSMFIPMLLLGFIINRRTRVIDVLNSVLVSRWPGIASVIIIYLMGQNETIGTFTSQVESLDNLNGFRMDWAAGIMIMAYGVPLIGLLILQIIVFYLSFGTAVNVRKGWHKALFFVILLIGEMISKAAIASIYF